MVQLIGIVAILLVAVLPAAVQPGLHLLAVEAAIGVTCAGGLLLPSLGLAVTGAIAALLAFSATLVIAPSASAIPQAVAMGTGLLVLLDLTYFRQRLAGSDVGAGVVLGHLANLAISVLLSVGAAALLIGVAVTMPVDLDPMVRPVMAAAGVILVLAALLRALTLARRQASGTGADSGQDGS